MDGWMLRDAFPDLAIYIKVSLNIIFIAVLFLI